MIDPTNQAELARLTQLRPDEDEVVVIRLAKPKTGGMRVRFAPSKELIVSEPTDLQALGLNLRDILRAGNKGPVTTTAVTPEGKVVTL